MSDPRKPVPIHDPKAAYVFDPESHEPQNRWFKESEDVLQKFYECKYASLLQKQIDTIIRAHTWGAWPKQPRALFSYADFVHLTGKTEQACITAIEDGIDRKVFHRISLGSKRSGFAYWPAAPGAEVRDYVVKKLIPVESEPAVKTLRGHQLTLFPGKRSKIWFAELNLLPGGGLVKVPYQCYNEFNQPVPVEIISTGGRLVIRFLDRANTKVQSRNDQPFVRPSGEIKPEGRPPRQSRLPLTKPTGSAPKPVAQDPRETEFRNFIVQLRLDAWGISTDEAFLGRCAELAEELPAAALAATLTVKHGESYRAVLRKHKPGLILNIIGDALTDYRARVEQPKPAAENGKSDAEKREWVSSLSDADYRELLQINPEMAKLVERPL